MRSEILLFTSFHSDEVFGKWIIGATLLMHANKSIKVESVIALLNVRVAHDAKRTSTIDVSVDMNVSNIVTIYRCLIFIYN